VRDFRLCVRLRHLGGFKFRCLAFSGVQGVVIVMVRLTTGCGSLCGTSDHDYGFVYSGSR
jgi:hypothetical protein